MLRRSGLCGGADECPGVCVATYGPPIATRSITVVKAPEGPMLLLHVCRMGSLFSACPIAAPSGRAGRSGFGTPMKFGNAGLSL